MQYHTTGYTITEGQSPKGVKVLKRINLPMFNIFLKKRSTKEVVFEDSKEIHYKLEDGTTLEVKKKVRRTKKNTPDLYGVNAAAIKSNNQQ